MMKTAIVYYSQHHGNTKKLLDAIKAADPSVELIDVVASPSADLSSYDRIHILYPIAGNQQGDEEYYQFGEVYTLPVVNACNRVGRLNR